MPTAEVTSAFPRSNPVLGSPDLLPLLPAVARGSGRGGDCDVAGVMNRGGGGDSGGGGGGDGGSGGLSAKTTPRTALRSTT